MHLRATFSSWQNGRWRHWLTGYLFVLPTLVIVAVSSIYPILYSLQLSFYDWNLIAPEPTFIGLRNFERLLTSSDFWHVIRNTLLVLLLDNKLRGMAFFRALFFIPISRRSLLLQRSGSFYSIRARG